jgi:8-oxo-dGTP diphosphatase
MTIIPKTRRRAIPRDELEFLERYDPSAFPSVAVTVDIVVLTVHHGALAVLLVERADYPFKGTWALPGGFLREGEDLDAAAARELTEETALHFPREDVHLEQLRTYGAPDRDPRMRVVSTAYLALVPDLPLPRAGGDAAAARYWPIETLASKHRPTLAFDHSQIINDAVERARSKLEYTSLATAFVSNPFTLGDLRRIYEAVWGTDLDPANFRRKVLSTPDFVEPTGGLLEPAGRGRPAELYQPGRTIQLHPPILRTAYIDGSPTTQTSKTTATSASRGRK